MTIGVTFFSKNEILLISDQFRYLLKDNVVKDVLAHRLEVTHENFEECVQNIYHDAPKIFRFGKNTGILAAGDTRFSSIITTLNKRKTVTKQILDELKQKKLDGFWSCRIGRYNKKKEKIELVTITYENGKVDVIEHDRDTVGFSAFSPEMKTIFFGKYATGFYLASSTKEKITIVEAFFDEISKLYNNKAGGQPIIARLDKNGFRWITKPKRSNVQNFTTYASNWCPEKIETTASSQLSWSQQTYTPVLELTFECESTMLLFINAFAAGFVHNDGASNGSLCLIQFMLTIDDNDVLQTPASLGCPLNQGSYFYSPYNTHSVAVIAKGSHTLRLLMLAVYAGTTAYCYNRRLTILKGFYAGGTT